MLPQRFALFEGLISVPNIILFVNYNLHLLSRGSLSTSSLLNVQL